MWHPCNWCHPHTAKNNYTYNCIYNCACVLCPYKGNITHGYCFVCGAPLRCNALKITEKCTRYGQIVHVGSSLFASGNRSE